MKIEPTPEPTSEELRPEYDLQQLQGGVRGNYYQRYQGRLHLVRLEPEVAAVFPTEEAVNHALRMLLNLARQEATTPAS